MRTKTIYFFSLFLTITMMTGCFHISSGPKPSKSKMTKKYSVTPFNKIENKAPANIVFTQGNVTKVEADGPDNYIPQLIVMVKDSTLSISMDKDKFKNFKSSKINISITSPVLCNIKQRGVGSIYLKDSVKVTDLSISAEGVGSIEANALMARCIKVSQEGVGSINLKGQAGHATYYLEGVGSLKAKDMIVSDVVVEQNGVSHINFPVQFGDTRKVTLEGEAMFEVTHDEARPFIIKTHDHTIYVLGTTFNISAYPDEELSVTLIEGKLKVNAPSGEYYLLPGEHYSSAQSKVYKVDPEFYISWTEGAMEFDAMPFPLLIARLSRCYNVDIQIASKELETMKFTGVIFRNKPLDFALDIIHRVSDVKFEKKGETILVKKQ